MIYGAILAGGTGKRIEKHAIPKQFITIGSVPIIVMTMRQFLGNKRIEFIYVAIHKNWLDYADNLFKDHFSCDELRKIRIVCGGKERLDSFINIMNDIIRKNGLNDKDILICHDAVRPFVREQMIDDCIDATIENRLALTVIPVSDTIHTSRETKYITGTLDRADLYNGQTPSGFNLALLHQVCEESSEEDKHKITGTTQLMLKSGYHIKMVEGHTSNFKITTDNDLDIADRIVRAQQKSRKISLLDCTLRDGGIVINFDFGSNRIQEIKRCLERAGVEYIECGYIDSEKGSERGRTCFKNDLSIKTEFLSTGKADGITYVAMIDYGTFDVKKLQDADPEGLDGIRLAFHKEHWKEAIACGRIILDKGYQLYIQPMVSVRYTDEEFRNLIFHCNDELAEASAFYIVDSFGQMDNMMLTHKLEIADQYVSPKMKIGFHAHNNRQMAFSNAYAFIQFPAKHELMLDSSVMGMGKGAGNLCTELIIPALIAEGNQYEVVGIYTEITRYFSHVIKKSPWGYCLDYYLSSLFGCTPSYIKSFTVHEKVSTDVLIDLLKNMPEDKKAAFDKKFAEAYLKSYFEKH